MVFLIKTANSATLVENLRINRDHSIKTAQSRIYCGDKDDVVASLNHLMWIYKSAQTESRIDEIY